ncbi:MAG: hypothetical protein Q8L53_02825 [Aestuariivirga sp.]|nr:hypothetical protein [Aestuariivirga sp.]
MTYNTSVTDTLDDHMLDDASIMGGRGADTVLDMPGLPLANRKLPARQARASADHDGIKAFMLDFTASAAKNETGESHMNNAQATRDFLNAASFLARK